MPNQGRAYFSVHPGTCAFVKLLVNGGGVWRRRNQGQLGAEERSSGEVGLGGAVLEDLRHGLAHFPS